MKTKAFTPKGVIYVVRHGAGFRLTHYSLPTCVVPDELALIAEIQDEQGEITLQMRDGSRLCLSKDQRHGQPGWRGSRYVEDVWDESYLFFRSITEALDTSETGDVSEALAAF